MKRYDVKTTAVAVEDPLGEWVPYTEVRHLEAKLDYPADIHLLIQAERERCIQALLAVNPMEVSFCDDVHGDGWWEAELRSVLERGKGAA